ncbi:MAG: hypothetical protein NVS3B16_05000 [Vulcanimicrobiaceae bacterium]
MKPLGTPAALAVALALTVSCAAVDAADTLLPAQTQTLPRCLEAEAALVSRLDSAQSVAGQSFTFKMTARVPARGSMPEIPLGTRGYGIVAYAEHAHGSGNPGRLVVEPRFLRLSDGTHVPVLADPQLSQGFVQGETRNVNGALAFVPGFGLAVGGYNALHRGREIVIERGTPFRVVLGDDLALGECFVPPPSALDVR